MKSFVKNSLHVFTVSGLIALSACEKDNTSDTDPDDDPAQKTTVKSTLESESRFSTMNEAVEESDQSDFFADASSNITLFAANNAAWDELFAEANVSSVTELKSKMGNDAFADLVLYHAVNGNFDIEQFDNGNEETLAENDNKARLTVNVKNQSDSRLALNGNDENGAATVGSGIRTGNGTVIEIDGALEAQTNFDEVEDGEQDNDLKLFVDIMADADASVANRLRDRNEESTVMLANDANMTSSLNIYLKNVIDEEDLDNLFDASSQSSLMAALNASSKADLISKITLDEILKLNTVTMADILAEFEAEDNTEIMNHFIFDGDADFEKMASGQTVTSEAGVEYEVTSTSSSSTTLRDSDGNEFILQGNSSQNANGSVYTLSEIN